MNLNSLGRSHCGQSVVGGAVETFRQVAQRVDDLGSDEPGTEHRHADSARSQFAAQALRKRDNAIFGYVVWDGRCREEISPAMDAVDTMCPPSPMLFDQRTENLDPPDDRHQIDAERPVPCRVGPSAIGPAAAYARVVDENVHLAITGDRRVRRRFSSDFSETSALTPSTSALVRFSLRPPSRAPLPRCRRA